MIVKQANESGEVKMENGDTLAVMLPSGKVITIRTTNDDAEVLLGDDYKLFWEVDDDEFGWEILEPYNLWKGSQRGEPGPSV